MVKSFQERSPTLASWNPQPLSMLPNVPYWQTDQARVCQAKDRDLFPLSAVKTEDEGERDPEEEGANSFHTDMI